MTNTDILSVLRCWIATFVIAAIIAAPAVAADFKAIRLKTSDTSFSRPHDLILSPDRQFLYVSDINNDVIKVLNPETLATVGVIGKGELSSPHDVTFDREGRLLVADTRNDRVAIYEVKGAQGKLIGEIKTEIGNPEGVAVAPDGRVYVATVRHGTVLAFEGGKIVARAGSHGSGPEQYIRPHDVHVDAKGRVFVVDSGNHRIKVLDRDLKIVKVLDQKTYNFNEPKYMKVDDRGWLYIADEYNSQLKVLDDAYRLVGVIGTGKKGSGPNELNWPEGVEVLGDRLWISDTYNDRILLYRIER